MGVTGELKVKMAEILGIDHWSMFKQQDKFVAGDTGQQCCLLGALSWAAGGIVYAGDDQRLANSQALVAQQGESSLADKIGRTLNSSVKFMVAGNGEFA